VNLVAKLNLTIATGLFLVGTFIIVGDVLFIRRYGFDFNDVAFVTATGAFADWPTGERPPYAMVPATGYGLGACLAGALVLALRPKANVTRRERRGTE
jgi:hypothetical protein